MTKSPSINVHRAAIDDRPILENLLEFYFYDFTDLAKLDLDETGRYGYPDLANYWKLEGRYPYLAKVDGKLAGFALGRLGSVISAAPEVWDMEHFFVMRQYRRAGIGSEIAKQVWSKHPGKWEVRVVQNNHGALKFWSNIIGREFPSEAAPIIAKANDKTYNIFQFKV